MASMIVRSSPAVQAVPVPAAFTTPTPDPGRIKLLRGERKAGTAMPALRCMIIP